MPIDTLTVLHRFGAATASTSAGKSDFRWAMPSTDACPRCHGDGILRHHKGGRTFQRNANGRPRRSSTAIDCPQCGGLGRLVAVTGADTAAASESLRAAMWPYTIHLTSAQRELFSATVLALLAELPPGTIGPGTITQACRTAQRQVLRGGVHHGASEHGSRPEVQRKGARFYARSIFKANTDFG